jgi:hypothetical protein
MTPEENRQETTFTHHGHELSTYSLRERFLAAQELVP